MNFNESKERFTESMAKAISRAREIGIATNNVSIWNGIAESLEGIRSKGIRMADAKGLSKSRVESDIKAREKYLTRNETIQ